MSDVWTKRRLRTAADLRKALRERRVVVRLAVALCDRHPNCLFPTTKSEIKRGLKGAAPDYPVRAVLVEPREPNEAGYLPVVVVGLVDIALPRGDEPADAS